MIKGTKKAQRDHLAPHLKRHAVRSARHRVNQYLRTYKQENLK